MLQGYPFWADAGAPTTPTIFDPILEASTTTLTFRGTKRDVKVMGVSMSGDTPTFLNNLRLRVGNSTPDYRYYEIPSNGFDHDSVVAGIGLNDVNYIDLGGITVQEGEAITLSCVGTGAFSGVLWVEDGEPGPIPIPNGNIVMLKLGGTNDAAAALSTTGGDMDTRKLENNRLYTPFMVQTAPEDDSIEIILLRAGKDSMTFPPAGKMIYPAAPIQFTGLQYNSGDVIMKVQVAAGTKVDCRVWMIESPIQGQEASPTAPQVEPVTGAGVPGVVEAANLVSAARGAGFRTARRTTNNQILRR